MIKSSNPKYSIARRLALLALAGLAAVLVMVGMTLAVIEHRAMHALMVQFIAGRVESMVAVADTADQINRGLMLKSFSGFRKEFDRPPKVDTASGEMHSGGNLVNGEFDAVDKFTRDTGGVAMVFVKKGGDFVCISTSIRGKERERALSMPLNAENSAYRTLLAGEAYTGRQRLNGTSYMTYYEPIKNAEGAVVGAFAIGNDVSLQDFVLEKQIADVHLFEQGGMYLLEVGAAVDDAQFLVHPEAKWRKVSEAFTDGGKFLSALDAAPGGYVRKAQSFLGDASADKWAVMRKTKSGTSWLVAEVSERESMAPYWINMAVIWSLLLVAALLLGGGLFLLVRKTISAPLRELTSAVAIVATGDLSQAFRSSRRDEIGLLVGSVEGMRQSYFDALGKVRASIDSISVASAEIANGNQDLSLRTEQAASNLQTTASSMDHLTEALKLSANAAGQANTLAASAAEVAARGGVVVGEVVSTMSDINQSAKRIGDITSVIDGIAFQTNILALNAAVEAARAGEQGRGFAVVASEVRNLAQRSAEAAKEIKELIGASVSRVESGSRLVQDAGRTMGEIVHSVKRVQDIIGEITAATAEQAGGIAQVNSAVAELDQMTQQNSALVEESAAASESLHEQAQNLAQVIATFKLTGGGAATTQTQLLG